jgi:hypothetical protein
MASLDVFSLYDKHLTRFKSHRHPKQEKISSKAVSDDNVEDSKMREFDRLQE